MHATMIGLDIAKSVFQVYGEDAEHRPVLRKRLGRVAMESFFAKLPAAVIGIEACGTAHHWARTLTAMGHTVRLIPAAYVRPFVKRNKTDARRACPRAGHWPDPGAEAICEAMQRPRMRQVPVKTVTQQASRGLETARDLLVRQHTQLMNSVRGLLAELGIVAAQGRRGFAVLPPGSRPATRPFTRSCCRPCKPCSSNGMEPARRSPSWKRGWSRGPRQMPPCAG